MKSTISRVSELSQFEYLIKIEAYIKPVNILK